MATGRANIINAMEYDVAYELSMSIFDLTLAYSKGQGQGFGHFDCEYH